MVASRSQLHSFILTAWEMSCQDSYVNLLLRMLLVSSSVILNSHSLQQSIGNYMKMAVNKKVDVSFNDVIHKEHAQITDINVCCLMCEILSQCDIINYYPDSRKCVTIIWESHFHHYHRQHGICHISKHWFKRISKHFSLL